ncbi:Voltage-gated Ion Channel (VIC) Superfamily [Achlya hypogyna]|uniref:Voltage-gated Ion Channel (VIC) Superfamily n=1 Tax=Achlya hypogyna TaxID=1202772 RepID=A0A1V9YM61_ACHHY|nr:Voltage-gated Ion Channel (VIC) Superfamily [Achlya hypogyna]
MLLAGRKPLPEIDLDDAPRWDSAPHVSLATRLSGITRTTQSALRLSGITRTTQSGMRLSGLFKSQRVLPLDGPSFAVDVPLRRATTLRDRVRQAKLQTKQVDPLTNKATGGEDRPTFGDSLRSKRWNRSSSVLVGHVRGSLGNLRIGRRQSLIRRTEEMKAHQEMISIFNLRQTQRASFRRRSGSSRPAAALSWQAVHPSAALLKVWQGAIVLVIAYEAVYVPFAVGFEPDLRGSSWELLNLVIDAIFFVDVLINFNVAYYQQDASDEQRTLTLKYSNSVGAKDKYLVRNRLRIAAHYAQGWLLLDLLAAIPIDWVEVYGSLSTADIHNAGLLKIVRLPRLVGIFRLFKVLKADGPLWGWLDYSKSSIGFRLLRLILIVMYMDHICTCVWYPIASAPGGWGETYFVPASLYATYVVCYYRNMMALLGQDIFPVLVPEMIFLTFASIAGSVALATVFGDVAIVVSSLYADSTKYREKMEDVNESMQHLGLPHEVQQRVHLYYTYLWQQYHTLDGRSAPFVAELSTNLQREIMLYLNARMIRSVPLMQECSPEVVQEIVLQLETRIYMPEDFIINIGETGFEMFFVQRGECEVLVEGDDPSRDKSVIKLITVGDYFGEIALLMDCRRTACVRAKTFCVLCVLHRSGFRQVIARHKEDKQKLESLIMEKYKNDAVKPKVSGHRPSPTQARPAPRVHLPTATHQNHRGTGMGADKTALRMLWDATTCLHDVTSRVTKMEQAIDKLTKAVRMMKTTREASVGATKLHLPRHGMVSLRRPSMRRLEEQTPIAAQDLDGSIHRHKRRYTHVHSPVEEVEIAQGSAATPSHQSHNRRLTAPPNHMDLFHDEAALQENILTDLDRVEQALLDDINELRLQSTSSSDDAKDAITST